MKTRRREFLNLAGQTVDKLLHRTRVKVDKTAPVGMLNPGYDLIFRLRVQRDAGQRIVLNVLTRNIPRQSPPHIFGQNFGVFGEGRRIGQCLHYADKVPDGNPLFEQAHQNFLDVAYRQHRRHKFRHDGRMILFDRVDQRLHVLSAQQLIAMSLDNFGQMGCQHGNRINHGIA